MTGALILEAAARGDKLKIQNLNAMDSTSEIGDQILRAAANGDLATLRGDTPLIEAAKAEQIHIVEYLLDQRAQINMVNLKGYTALHYAVLKDNRELIELLLKKGALIEVDSVDGTPLQLAASHGNVEVVKFLLSRGAEPDDNYVVMETPLVCAINAHSFECMDLLLKANANPKSYFIRLSPLSIAAKESDTRFIKSLLEAGADPNEASTELLKPIEVAAMVYNREGVEILFPLTEQLQKYPNWSVDGIMEYFHSEEAKEQRDDYRIARLLALRTLGAIESSRGKYNTATRRYRMALHLDPSNPEWLSKLSLCHAHKGRLAHAMFDAEKCLRFEPRIPGPHSREDAAAAAAKIVKKFLMAGLAFVLNPYKEETDEAFRVALFDYFAWLYQMNDLDEIMCFTPNSK